MIASVHIEQAVKVQIDVDGGASITISAFVVRR
jgi:hypothetical protein